MKFINTIVHAVLDYLWAMLLIASPFILHFENTMSIVVPIVFGAITIAMSLMTDYEGSIVKWIPFKTHLLLDVLSGLILLATPWLYNYENVKTVFIVFGVFAVLAAIFSCPTPLFVFPKRSRN